MFVNIWNKVNMISISRKNDKLLFFREMFVNIWTPCLDFLIHMMRWYHSWFYFYIVINNGIKIMELPRTCSSSIPYCSGVFGFEKKILKVRAWMKVRHLVLLKILHCAWNTTSSTLFRIATYVLQFLKKKPDK